LSKALQPAGFEALAGIVVKDPAPARKASVVPEQKAGHGRSAASATAAAQAEARRQQQAAERERLAAIEHAGAEVDRARRAEELARAELVRLTRDREAAEALLARLRDQN